MKEIKGYLIDRTTGAGISGKSVTFKDLAGSDIATGTHGTVYQVKDTVTQADGSFSFKCELSPGPIQVEVTASGSEKKERKWDEQAQMSYQWSSDISRIGKAIHSGVVNGYLSDLALSIVSGHTFRIAKGAAVIDGGVWSLEDLGGASGYDILGTTNPGGSGLNPRLDLVSLRQYKQSAAGQLSGKQDVVVTLGVTSNTVPAVPTSTDYTCLPIGVLSTAEGAATKTIYTSHNYPNYTPNMSCIHYSGTWASLSLAAGGTSNRDFTVPGARDGDVVFPYITTLFGTGYLVVKAYVNADNTVRVVVFNASDTTSYTGGTHTIHLMVMRFPAT